MEQKRAPRIFCELRASVASIQPPLPPQDFLPTPIRLGRIAGANRGERGWHRSSNGRRICCVH